MRLNIPVQQGVAGGGARNRGMFHKRFDYNSTQPFFIDPNKRNAQLTGQFDAKLSSWLDVSGIENILYGSEELAEAMTDRRFIMRKIYQMHSTGLVSAASNYRNTMIQIHRMVIEEVAGAIPTRSIDRHIRKHIQPMAWEIHNYFAMYGLCPYQWKSVTMYVGDDEERKRKWGDNASNFIRIRVPVPLPVDTFDIETTLDKRGNKIHIVTDNDGDVVKNVLYSRYRGGPKYKDPGFETECGAVLPDWLNLMMIKATITKLQQAETNPVVYTEPVRETISQQSGAARDQNRRTTEYVFNKFGYRVPLPPRLKSSDGMVMLPDGFTMSSHQPLAKVLLDEQLATRNFISLLAAQFNISYRIFSSESGASGGIKGGRDSAAVIEMDQKRARDVLRLHIDDIQEAIQEIWAHQFENFGAKVFIPMSSMVDMETLYSLHERKFVNDDFAVTEALNLMGIHQDQHDKVKGKPDPNFGRAGAGAAVAAPKPKKKSKDKEKKSKDKEKKKRPREDSKDESESGSKKQKKESEKSKESSDDKKKKKKDDSDSGSDSESSKSSRGESKVKSKKSAKKRHADSDSDSGSESESDSKKSKSKDKEESKDKDKDKKEKKKKSADSGSDSESESDSDSEKQSKSKSKDKESKDKDSKKKKKDESDSSESESDDDDKSKSKDKKEDKSKDKKKKKNADSESDSESESEDEKPKKKKKKREPKESKDKKKKE